MAVRPVHGISLCAGGGGLDLGLDIAIPGYRTVCYVEREAYAASVLVARMAEAALSQAPVWDSIESFDGKPWRGLVHLISAGDPCQPWSHAGQRKGYDDERVVFDDVARIVGEVEPEFVFLENVAGAIDFRYDCKAVLESMGYRVEAGLFSAAEVGASQERERCFLLAYAASNLWRASGDGGRITSDGASNLPLFAPGRNEIDAWLEVLSIDPSLEPAIRGDADGLSYRVERLQALGNAVVPLTAALAFATLYKRLIRDEEAL